MRKKVFISVISLIFFISIGLFFISCNLSDILSDIDIGSIWEVFGYNKPANLQAMAVSDSQIYLSWEDKVTGEDGFKIEVTDEDLNATVISVEKNTTEYYHKPLNSDMLYIYKMHAYDGTGNSEYSNIAFAKTDVAASVAPEAPTNLQAQAISDTRIELSWDDNSSDEDGFRVYRSTDDSTYDLIDTTNPNITEYTDTGLTMSTLYYYKVSATNSVGETNIDLMDPASATTEAAPGSVPEDPTNLQAAAISNMRIDLSWADNSDNEESFVVQISSNGTTFSTIGEVKPNVTTFQSTSLKPETKYYYRVYATNSYDPFMSGYTNTANATTKPTPGTVPAAPTNLQAKAVSDTQIKIGWTDNSTDEDGFNVFISKDGDEFFWMAKVKPNETVYLVGGLPANYTFYFKVSAFNFFGESALSNAASATTLPAATDVPAAPTNLVAKTVSDTQIAIGWYDNSNNEDGFNIYISKDNGVNYVWLTKVRPDTKEYVVGGLQPKYTFYFKVNAYNRYGTSAFSNPAYATTGSEPGSAPAAPSNLVAKAASDTAITMAWTDNSDNEDGFNIEVSGDGLRFEFLDKVGPNENRYYLGGLKPNLTLYFRVNAFNREGKSDYSNIAKATTLPEASGVPADPTNLLTRTVSDTVIDIQWSDNSDNEDAFNIEMAVGLSPAPEDYRWIEKVKPNTTYYSVGGLRPSMQYWFRVNAVNAVGSSENYAGPETATTNAAPGDGDVPADPTKLFAAAKSDSMIAIEWSDNSDNEDGFNIEISLDDLTYEHFDTVGPNVKEYAAEGLKPETTYYFRVNAFNREGKSDYSNIAKATTLPTSETAPSAPEGLEAFVRSDSAIALAWRDMSDNEDGFNIELSENGTDYKFVDTVAPNVSEYIVEGLPANTQFWFRVNAFNAEGKSDYCDPVSATTQPEPGTVPNAPSSLTATAKSDSVIVLVWSDNSDNEEGFVIEWGPGDDRWYTLDKIKADQVEYGVEGLKPLTTYYFRVLAYNEKGNSTYSNTANATTLESPTLAPTAPTGLTATAIGDLVIRLTWTDNSTVEESFIIQRGPDGIEFKDIVKVKAVEGTGEVIYEDGGLTEGRTYHYRVYATNSAGASDPCDPASATAVKELK
ncbi:MAG TPA: fibronectin type III domain-containing protein [Spirochaetota bacterium]|nr:fibronectin type III domain-containing protein [Spirochaetota bacterium]